MKTPVISTRLKHFRRLVKIAAKSDLPPGESQEWSEEDPTRPGLSPQALDLYHYREWEKSQGLIPGSGGMMTEEERRRGVEDLKKNRPEYFDPERIKQEKDWKATYKRVSPYYETLDPQHKVLDPELAAELSGALIPLVGKEIEIFTGSPRLPKTREVRLLDVNLDNQTIIFETLDKKMRYQTSYDDFFYHDKLGMSDAERSGLTFPDKLGFLSKFWKGILKRVKP